MGFGMCQEVPPQVLLPESLSQDGLEAAKSSV